MTKDTVSRIYHRVPQNFTGSVLYPLNVLEAELPECYANQAKKYVGREALTEQIIPPLGCYWNDVLHFSPVHPALIKEGLIAAGFEPQITRWFVVAPIALGFNQHNAAIYLHPAKDRLDFRKMADDFMPFDRRALGGLGNLPEATLTYYKISRKEHKSPLLFHRIPHILYQGSLSLDQMSTVTV
jgi:hypothetical protein